MKVNIALLILFTVASSFSLRESSPVVVRVCSEEVRLYNLIMDYREAYHLPVIPLSKALTYVAQEHCNDVSPDVKSMVPGKCGISNMAASAKWTDATMWDKPNEIAGYTGKGFEISYSSCCLAKADKALTRWKGSQYHNEIILNQGYWKKKQWNAIGIGVKNGFIAIWFGEQIEKEDLLVLN